MKRLLEEKQYFNLPKIGDLVKGTVIASGKNEVHIDLGGVMTGIVRGRECYGESEEYKNLKPGDEVEGTVLELENENGEMELSFRYAGRQKAWLNISTKEKEGAIVEAIVTEANKGGLMVKVENSMGFLPVSQLSPEHYPRVPGGDKNRILEILKGYIGKKFETKIIDANEIEDKLIVSEKAAWEETQQHVINKYKIGDVIEGVVTAVTNFGVFVEFDKLEGLIHISEIAWQRIDNPNDYVKTGQKVKAQIIGIENSKIFLSMKKMEKDPWDGIEKKFKVGQKVKGKIVKTNPFGLFVEIDTDIQGLAHISQLSEKPIENINSFAKDGDEMEFYIVSMEPKDHRLGLSITKPKEKEKKEEKAKKETKSEEIEEKKKETKEIKEEEKEKELEKEIVEEAGEVAIEKEEAKEETEK